MSPRTDNKDRVTSSALLTIALVFCQLLRITTTTCDVHCNCQQSDKGIHVICLNMESLSNRSVFPDDVFRLEIRNNAFQNGVITNVTFPSLQNLRHLAITRSNVTKITSLAFVRFGALQVLRLSNNIISDLAFAAFEGLNYTREIFLDGNRLVYLPEGLFRGLDLELLDLSDNLFAQIPGDSFRGSAVRFLNLNLNFVESMEDSSLYSLRTSLRELTLSYNKGPLRLHEASISWFNLTRLEMINSQISDTSFLINSTVLEVDISGNVPHSEELWSSLRLSNTEVLHARNLSLVSLAADSLASLTSAKVLDFSMNRLSVVRSEAFADTPQLRHLNLAHNNLGRLGKEFGEYLRNLELLNLSGNVLRYLPDESLLGMVQLKVLDLRENRVQFISESAFRMASVMTRIEGNPLHCNCQLLWLRSLLQGHREDATSLAVTCASPFSGPLASADENQLTCSPPLLETLQETASVIEGDDLLLTCSATSDPPASISWIKDQNSILMSVAPSVMQDRTYTRMTAVLRLRRTSPRNAGTYVCHAKNVVGNATETLTARVLPKDVASHSITSSVEEQSLSLTTVSALRKRLVTTSSDPRRTTRTLFPEANFTISIQNWNEMEESTMELPSMSANDTSRKPAVDSASPVSESTEVISTNRQSHVTFADNFNNKLNPLRPTLSSVEPFAVQFTSSGKTNEETPNNRSNQGFTNLSNSDRHADMTSTSVASAKFTVQTNVSNSSDSVFHYIRRVSLDEDSATTFETWKSDMENDLRKEGLGNDSNGNKEAKLLPGSFGGIDIAGSIPMVGIMTALVCLVILSGFCVVWWSKMRGQHRNYKVRPSPRGPADSFELRSYDNEVTLSVDSVS